MNPLSIEQTAGKAKIFRALHHRSQTLVLPNAWDAASARAFESAGFPAIATTSGGVSASLGYQDREDGPVDEMLAAAKRIISAVEIPVTVDFEAGYKLEPSEIAERLLACGAAGLNLEDTDHYSETALVDVERHAERLAALKAAALSNGADLFLNARVDVFIHRLGTPEEQLAECLRRARFYKEAGADCIYPILLGDAAMIGTIVDAVGLININVRRGGPLTLRDAEALGVGRVTYASSIFREAMSAVDQAAEAVKAELSSSRMG